MSVSTKASLAAVCALMLGLSAGAMAQTAQGSKKSSEVTTMGEGDAVMIGAKSHKLHKSNAKVTAAHHDVAMKKGAREIKPGAVLYKQSGKLYLMEDSANERASQSFQDHFDIDY